MPNLRTTVLIKKRAHDIAVGDLMKIGGRWHRVVDVSKGYTDLRERNFTLVPENTTDRYSPQRVIFLVHGLVKFKVRTPK